jgi:GR25 family glycosyltransferase involved in LPS biosynthesis
LKRFVIHVNGSNRRDTMLKELNAHYEGEFEIFDAIVKPNAYEGISESFKAVIKKNYNEPEIHIFEDDVRFVSKYSRVIFDKNYNQLPSDWGIYLGGSYTYSEKENLGDLLVVENYRSFHSVVIKKRCYDYFLSHNPSVVNNIDAHVCNLEKIAYLCNPQVAIQYNGYSFNRGKEVNYDYHLKNKNILDESKLIL